MSDVRNGAGILTPKSRGKACIRAHGYSHPAFSRQENLLGICQNIGTLVLVLGLSGAVGPSDRLTVLKAKALSAC